MPISVRDGGSWKPLALSAHDAGSWKAPSAIYVRDGGVWKIANGVLLLSTSITIGNVGAIFGYTRNTTDGSIGNAGTTTFSSPGSGSQRMDDFYYNGAALRFGLSVNGQPNTDSTFKFIVVGGIAYSRAAASYTSNYGADTMWGWVVGSNVVGTSGSASISIYG